MGLHLVDRIRRRVCKRPVRLFPLGSWGPSKCAQDSSIVTLASGAVRSCRSRTDRCWPTNSAVKLRAHRNSSQFLWIEASPLAIGLFGCDPSSLSFSSRLSLHTILQSSGYPRSSLAITVKSALPCQSSFSSSISQRNYFAMAGPRIKN